MPEPVGVACVLDVGRLPDEEPLLAAGPVLPDLAEHYLAERRAIDGLLDELLDAVVRGDVAPVPELADEIGGGDREEALGVSEDRRRGLKAEAKAAYLKRRSLRFAEFVLEGDGVGGSQGQYLDDRR